MNDILNAFKSISTTSGEENSNLELPKQLNATNVLNIKKSKSSNKKSNSTKTLAALKRKLHAVKEDDTADQFSKKKTNRKVENNSAITMDLMNAETTSMNAETIMNAETTESVQVVSGISNSSSAVKMSQVNKNRSSSSLIAASLNETILRQQNKLLADTIKDLENKVSDLMLVIKSQSQSALVPEKNNLSNFNKRNAGLYKESLSENSVNLPCDDNILSPVPPNSFSCFSKSKNLHEAPFGNKNLSSNRFAALQSEDGLLDDDYEDMMLMDRTLKDPSKSTKVININGRNVIARKMVDQFPSLANTNFSRNRKINTFPMSSNPNPNLSSLPSTSSHIHSVFPDPNQGNNKNHHNNSSTSLNIPPVIPTHNKTPTRVQINRKIPSVTCYDILPSIIIPKIKNIIGKFNIKVINKSKIRIHTDAIKDQKTLIEYLKSNQIHYFTHTCQEDKLLSFVLRGLDPNTDLNDILEEIKSHIPTVTRVNKFLTPSMKKNNSRNLFLLQFSPNTNIGEIMRINHIQYQMVKVEKINSRGMTQCYRCQQWGHSSANCGMQPKCVKCALPHESGNCLLPPKGTTVTVNDDNGNTSSVNVTAKCCNCGGPHTANYKGCPRYRDIRQRIESRKNLLFERKDHARNLEKTNNRQTYASSVRPNFSYANNFHPGSFEGDRNNTGDGGNGTNGTRNDSSINTNNNPTNSIPSPPTNATSLFGFNIEHFMMALYQKMNQFAACRSEQDKAFKVFAFITNYIISNVHI